jgi:hypothetical protein
MVARLINIRPAHTGALGERAASPSRAWFDTALRSLRGPATTAIAGKAMHQGCLLCHRLWGSPGQLPSFVHMLGTLDVGTNGLRTHTACRVYIVGRRPQVSCSQPAPKRRKLYEQLSRRGPLQDFYRVGDGDRRRDREEQVNVIRLDFLGDHRPGIFLTDRIEHAGNGRRDSTHEHIAPILRTPYHMVGRLVETIAIMDDFQHFHMVASNCAKRNLAFLPRLKSRVSSEDFL